MWNGANWINGRLEGGEEPLLWCKALHARGWNTAVGFPGDHLILGWHCFAYEDIAYEYTSVHGEQYLGLQIKKLVLYPAQK